MKDIIKKINKARFVFTCGNGGSSATAEHFANDLFKQGISAICLNSNTSIITMIANDYGYEEIFSEQLATFATSEDLLIVFSVSGTSPNILKVLFMAEELGCDVVKFFGKNGESFGDAEDRHLKLTHKISKQI